VDVSDGTVEETGSHGSIRLDDGGDPGGAAGRRLRCSFSELSTIKPDSRSAACSDRSLSISSSRCLISCGPGRSADCCSAPPRPGRWKTSEVKSVARKEEEEVVVEELERTGPVSKYDEQWRSRTRETSCMGLFRLLPEAFDVPEGLADIFLPCAVVEHAEADDRPRAEAR
jgi:hypothetical protein